MTLNTKVVVEIENMTTQQLKEILIEASDWSGLSLKQQYESKLYKLTSDLIAVYGSCVSVQMVYENVATEVANRIVGNIKKKS